MFINIRILAVGLLLWAIGTAVARLAGQFVLPPGGVSATITLIAGSVVATAWGVRTAMRRASVPPHQWADAALALMLPTLALDAWSAAFFPYVFPNIAPDAAGIFAAWMLACCAGAGLGVVVGRTTR